MSKNMDLLFGGKNMLPKCMLFFCIAIRILLVSGKLIPNYCSNEKHGVLPTIKDDLISSVIRQMKVNRGNALSCITIIAETTENHFTSGRVSL